MISILRFLLIFSTTFLIVRQYSQNRQLLKNLRTIWNVTEPLFVPKLSSSETSDGEKKQICEGYNGVLLIDHGAPKAGAGAMFFFLILNQLIYADIHNLKPWIHLNNSTAFVYDETVHNNNNTPVITFEMMDGMKVVEPHLEPKIPDGETLMPRKFAFAGNGVWNSYLEPASDFPSLLEENKDESCRNKPLVQVLGKIHNRGPSWVVKAWKYGGDNGPVHLPFHQWIEPHRKRGHDMVRKYYRFLPLIREAADKLTPRSIGSDTSNCMAMHIRHSDKSSRRRIVPTSAYLEYVEAFVRGGGNWIYLATDSALVGPEIQTQWPSSIQKRIITQGDHVVRSNNTQPVFALAGHHRTNTEIFIDILAMSKCQFLIHTLSSVAEATIFLNLNLHNHSVNLEDDHPMSAANFEALVRKSLNVSQSTTIQ